MWRTDTRSVYALEQPLLLTADFPPDMERLNNDAPRFHHGKIAVSQAMEQIAMQALRYADYRLNANRMAAALRASTGAFHPSEQAGAARCGWQNRACPLLQDERRWILVLVLPSRQFSISSGLPGWLPAPPLKHLR
jgi:hypothetical protein